MTAPGPVPGANPWIGTYQVKQYSTHIPPLTNSVLDALASPPASGVTAENPTNIYLENTNPPVGSGDNEPGNEEY